MRVLLLLMLLTGCSISIDESNKPTAGQVPSADSSVLAGKSLTGSSRTMATMSLNGYSLLDRLYDTAWYQTEKPHDSTFKFNSLFFSLY